MHQKPLPPYFRKELQQRIRDGVCPGKAPWAPARLYWVSGLSSQEGGAASWAWGAAGSQSSKGLLAPRVRWGGSGWTGASDLGEGSRQEMSLESLPGGRGEARAGVRAGQTGHSQPHTGDGGPVGSNSEPEGLVLRNTASFFCSFVKRGVRV